MTTPLDTMVAAYIEALYFTETGDTDQPGHDAELTPHCAAKCALDCRNFYWALTEGRVAGLDADAIDWGQVGHDLWLTRNGHGTGFWDRHEIYGEDNSVLLTCMARAVGPHDAEFIDPADIHAALAQARAAIAQAEGDQK